MAGKSTGKKSRFMVKAPGEDRSAKRHKPTYSIKQFLQPRPPQQADGGGDRGSSEEPDDQLPSQTPAVHLLPTALAAAAQFTAPTGGPKLQTVLLRSLQHRFATQQALETPAGLAATAVAGGGDQLLQQAHAAPRCLAAAQQQPQTIEEEFDDEEEEDGFQIFSQLTYEPTFLSQRLPDLGPGQEAAAPATAVADTSQQATQTQALPDSQAAAPAAAEAEEEEGLDWPGSQLLSQHQQQEALRRASGVSATHKTTPALQSSERVRCDGAAASGQKMFPLFRKRDNLKRLYIVRHGESTYNAAMARGSSWADPNIFDAQLTDRGKQQACALRKQLAALDLPPDTLWLTSPLQRAMQTLLLACPTSHLLAGEGWDDAAAGCNAENSGAAPNGGSSSPPKVMVLQSISEKVITSGDIGSPASELRKRYPQLGGQLAALPELWWHCPPDKPNCALRKLFGGHESKDQVMVRIGAFRRWLQERPESVVVAVGHSSYWRTFEEVCRGTKPAHMRNCEFRLIHF